MATTVKIATTEEYWGEEPTQADLDALAAVVRQMGGIPEFVDETFSVPNRNRGRAADILAAAWDKWSNQR